MCNGTSYSRPNPADFDAVCGAGIEGLFVSEPLLATRGARAIADGLMAASFAALLNSRGLDELALGWMVTATLLGSATLLLLVSRYPTALRPLRVLVVCAALMVVTGAAFASTGLLAILVPLAVIGPLNPTGGDVSAFLPAEQALTAERTPAEQRSAMFARYSLVGFAGALVGSLLAGPVAAVGRNIGFRSTEGRHLIGERVSGCDRGTD